VPKPKYDDVTDSEYQALFAAKSYFGSWYRSEIQAMWVTRRCPTGLLKWMHPLLLLQSARGASWLNSFDFSKVKPRRKLQDEWG
jgi:hypothetical protein